MRVLDALMLGQPQRGLVGTHAAFACGAGVGDRQSYCGESLSHRWDGRRRGRRG